MKYNESNRTGDYHMKKKSIIALVCGLFAGFAAVMLFLHRGLILAMITGEELPEAPEGCPASKF